MSYQVLARKWRPLDFDSILGQESVVQALQNSLTQNRLHHAYLFTGTRGIGKTTIARVFAKALCCEKGVTSSPCGICANCTAIADGTFVDMLEVDAASRTGVDDTRDLLNNVQYLPNIGKYKIYLIDEVHMFSKSSFNALLKTLEEPPEYVIFLLATTDPQKLPATVLSRCLQFNLSRLETEQLSDYFVSLLEKEKISFTKPAIDLLAQAADGSVRDGLSLLDQAIAFGNGEIITTDVQKMLGTIENEHIQAILKCLMDNDINQLLQTMHDVSLYTNDFAKVLDALADYLHQITISQLTNDKSMPKFVHAFSLETIQLLYQIAIQSKQDLPLAPTMKIGLSMALLRMAVFMPSSKKKHKN